MDSRKTESSTSSSSSQEQPPGSIDGSTTSAEGMPEKYADVRCTQLYNEWRRCISASSQFHQYYIYGAFKDCTKERSRLFNCIRWKSFKNQTAKNELVKSFDTERQDMHTSDPPWEMRSSPPSDWNK